MSGMSDTSGNERNERHKRHERAHRAPDRTQPYKHEPTNTSPSTLLFNIGKNSSLCFRRWLIFAPRARPMMKRMQHELDDELDGAGRSWTELDTELE
jgi:hypothetical protein